MKTAIVLARHSLRRMRVLLVAGCAILFALQNLLVLVARSFERSGAFAQLSGFIPDFIRPLLDPSFNAVLSFGGMVSLGYAHVIVLALLVGLGIVAGTEPLGEIDAKFVDLTMSRPVPRHAAVARSMMVMIVATGAPVATMLVGTQFGIAVFAPASAAGPPLETLLALALNLELLAVAWGAVALAFASCLGRRAAAAAAVSLLAFATFLLDYVGRVWGPLAQATRLSPFHYFSPFAIIAGEPVPIESILVLSAISAAGFTVAFVAWQRRDL